mmetsp:Transcript_18928/g.43919  ORF Transcript_18928/g.43919 Transcript_18928/m.43919 type:complete len:103 (+) Transcript_18928:2063-2371(+)
MGCIVSITSFNFINIEWLLYIMITWDISTMPMVPKNITYTGSLVFIKLNMGFTKHSRKQPQMHLAIFEYIFAETPSILPSLSLAYLPREKRSRSLRTPGAIG